MAIAYVTGWFSSAASAASSTASAVTTVTQVLKTNPDSAPPVDDERPAFELGKNALHPLMTMFRLATLSAVDKQYKDLKLMPKNFALKLQPNTYKTAYTRRSEHINGQAVAKTIGEQVRRALRWYPPQSSSHLQSLYQRVQQGLEQQEKTYSKTQPVVAEAFKAIATTIKNAKSTEIPVFPKNSYAACVHNLITPETIAQIVKLIEELYKCKTEELDVKYQKFNDILDPLITKFARITWLAMRHFMLLHTPNSTIHINQLTAAEIGKLTLEELAIADPLSTLVTLAMIPDYDSQTKLAFHTDIGLQPSDSSRLRRFQQAVARWWNNDSRNDLPHLLERVRAALTIYLNTSHVYDSLAMYESNQVYNSCPPSIRNIFWLAIAGLQQLQKTYDQAPAPETSNLLSQVILDLYQACRHGQFPSPAPALSVYNWDLSLLWFRDPNKILTIAGLLQVATSPDPLKIDPHQANNQKNLASTTTTDKRTSSDPIRPQQASKTEQDQKVQGDSIHKVMIVDKRVFASFQQDFKLSRLRKTLPIERQTIYMYLAEQHDAYLKLMTTLVKSFLDMAENSGCELELLDPQSIR